MKKAVFFDIDGTLWDRQMHIPDSTREAVRLLKENGIYTFICSGRAPAFIQNPDLLSMDFDGLLAGCGTYVSFQGKELYYKKLEPEIIEKSIQILKKYHMPVVWEGKNYQYLAGEDFEKDRYFPIMKQELGDRLQSVEDFWMEWEASKFSATLSGCQEEEYKKALEELSPWYDFMVHEHIVAEGVPKGHSKATGIQKACETLDIAREDTYAFGDSVNDLEMLKYVAHGIAMGNGTPEAKAAADYVTEDLDKDGIYLGCKHFGLI